MSVANYPKPRRSEVREVLHGVTVDDPYRWMEDPEAEETKSFVEAQNNVSKPFLAKCPYKDVMKEQLTKLWNFPRFSAPRRIGKHYYYSHNTGLQNQDVVYRKSELNGEPELFFDPNTLSEDGTISMTLSRFSKNETYHCYGLSEGGSDWSTLYIKEVATGKILPDKVERYRYTTCSWTHDEKGFFYGQYPDWTGKVSGKEAKAAEKQKLFYHRVSTPQSEDVMCVEFPDHPKYMFYPTVSDCGRYLIVNISEVCKTNLIYVADISNGITGQLKLIPVYDKMDCRIEYVTNDGSIFYFSTDKDRPNGALIKLDLNKPTEWTDVIPEHPKDVLDDVTAVDNNKFVAGYLHDVLSRVDVFSMDGKHLQTLPFEVGTIGLAEVERSKSELFFRFTSFLTPCKIYRCEIDKAPNAVLEVHKTVELDGVNTDDLKTEQVFYTSQDGTKVPMFITRNKDLPLDGSAPCLLYVYGGFNISIVPSFSLFRLSLLKRLGMTVAIANVRGGGEYGEKWYEAGRLSNKQNTFDDVQSAAAFLADSGYAKPSKLVLMGGSNGGMVVTACANQRPELFGAVIAQVPVTDIYRFHKFTVGSAWTCDFGDPEKHEDFQTQQKYSPLHNIPDQIDNYPSVLVVTADHDDRVVPSHSLKFIAELQHRLGDKNKNPLLALVHTKAGHGAGKPTTMIIDELVEIMCFLQTTFGLKYNS